MKKGSKSNILATLFLLVVFTMLGLGYVSIKLKCEQLAKDKVLAEEKLNAVRNTRLSLVASEQNLSSEERIVRVAKDELGMVRKDAPWMQVKVSRQKIEEINQALRKKYE